MTPSLDVLIVDDDDFRAEISTDILKTLNPAVNVTVVENYDAFQIALQTKKWALCVLDGEFPQNASSGIRYTEDPLGMKALIALEAQGYSQNNVVVLSGNEAMLLHSMNRGYSAASVSIAETSVKWRVLSVLKPQYEYHV